MELEELEQDFPSIAWREPIVMRAYGNARLCCRVCIANDGGINPDEIETRGFVEDADFRTHFAMEHLKSKAA